MTACARQLAVASCPCDDRNLHFFVPRDDEDPLAARLFGGALAVGDPVTIWGPHGQFSLAEGSQPLVFAACDTGFAPVKSLIEHALSLDAAPSVSLFWLATRPDGHFLANQCRAWSEALDAFEYTLSTDSDEVAGALQIAAAMRADLFDIDCAFYIAGPQRLRGNAGGRARRLGRAHGANPRGGLRMTCGCNTPAPAGADQEDAGCSGGESFALRVLGDDMAPEFNEGDIIIVEPDGALKDGSFVLARLRTEWIFRQLARRGEGWCLRALNPRAGPGGPVAAGLVGGARRRHPEGRARPAQLDQTLAHSETA